MPAKKPPAAPLPAPSRAPRKGAPPSPPAAAAAAVVPTAAAKPPATPVVDLEHYAPAYFTWIANKLSRGASQAYLSCFGVGIETWRVLVLLAIEGPISAQRACLSIGMDKSSMSRCFKDMQASGFITLASDPTDGRARIARITSQGRALHNRIRELALLREQAFMAVLDADERSMLLGLLHRLHDNLPAVEAATQQFLARQRPRTGRARRAAAAPSSPHPVPGASA